MSKGPAMPAAIGALLLAASCAPVVQIGGNAPRPDALLTLAAPAVAAPAGVQPVSMAEALSIAIPDMPGVLRTVRIPVTVSDTQVQYLKAAQWAEQPNRLFQRLLADTLTSAGVPVIDTRSSGRAAERQLSGQLLAFGVDVRGPAPVARVRYDATLSGPDGLRQRRFEQEAPLAQVTGDAAAVALNQAANAVAADVARWAMAAAAS